MISIPFSDRKVSKGKRHYYTINYPAIFDAQFNWILRYSSLFPKNVKQVPFRQDFYLN